MTTVRTEQNDLDDLGFKKLKAPRKKDRPKKSDLLREVIRAEEEEDEDARFLQEIDSNSAYSNY